MRVPGGERPGGYMTVATIAERNAIPTWKRAIGMFVYVVADNSFQQLAADLISWTAPNLYPGSVANLTDPNSNFYGADALVANSNTNGGAVTQTGGVGSSATVLGGPAGDGGPITSVGGEAGSVTNGAVAGSAGPSLFSGGPGSTAGDAISQAGAGATGIVQGGAGGVANSNALAAGAGGEGSTLGGNGGENQLNGLGGKGGPALVRGGIGGPTAGTTGGDGGDATLEGGAGDGSGNTDGGNTFVDGGAANSAGLTGIVRVGTVRPAALVWGQRQALTAPGAVDVTAQTTYLTSDGSSAPFQAVTLADGLANGQRKIITFGTKIALLDSITLVPTNFEYTSVTFTVQMQSVELEWDGTQWLLLDVTGGTTVTP